MSKILSFIKKHAKMLIIILAAVLVVTGTTVGLVIGLSEDDPQAPVTFPGITPDYPAPPVDEGAEDYEGENGGKLEAPEEGGSAVSLIYSDKVTIDLSDKKATLDFRNPSASLQNMTVQLVIQDQVVAESGLLVAGKRLSELSLKEGMENNIPVGYYNQNAKFVIRYYDPATNECAIINTEIALMVTVQE